MIEAENNGEFSYQPVRSNRGDDDEDENFDDAIDAPNAEAPNQTNRIIPSDRSGTQSPMNSSISSVSQKANVLLSLNRESSKAASIKSNAATIGSVRQASVSDLEKELEDLDIDLDSNDVSNAKNGSSETQKVFQSTTDENEVNL